MGQREFKGKNIIDFPDEYICFDVETTGLDFEYDEIIEISAIHIKYGNIIDKFTSLVKPKKNIIPCSITELTGITNEMISDAPDPEKVFPQFIKFVKEFTLVGHNVNFDINFAYDACSKSGLTLKNNFIDTMRISRKLFPDEKHHRLCDMSKRLSIKQETSHRAESDAITTMKCLEKMREKVQQQSTLSEFKDSFTSIKSKEYYKKIHSISATVDDFDETHPIYEKYIVITGKLSSMTRAEAKQMILNFGGHFEDTITKKTNFLVVGTDEASKARTNGKTGKMQKAEKYQKEGQDIIVLSENTFFDMIEQ